MGPLYSNYLGYPGAPSGTAAADPRMAQFQQQMQLYQLARLKMSQMNQFKGMPQAMQNAGQAMQNLPQFATSGQPTPGQASTGQSTPGQPAPIYAPGQSVPVSMPSTQLAPRSTGEAEGSSGTPVALSSHPTRHPNQPLPGAQPADMRAYQQQMTLQYLLQNQARAAYIQQVYGPKHPAAPGALLLPPAYGPKNGPSGAPNSNDPTHRPALAT